jgi:hypothetical protein
VASTSRTFSAGLSNSDDAIPIEEAGEETTISATGGGSVSISPPDLPAATTAII